jgi:hypothetical protein
MIALPTGVLAWGRGGDAVCVSGAEVSPARRSVTAADWRGGLLWLLDAKGIPFVSEPSAVCGSGGLEEGLVETAYTTPAIGVWEFASRSIGAPFPTTANRGHLAVRPDGYVLFASEGLRPLGGETGGMWRDRLYRLKPSFTPRVFEERLERLDPRRRERAFGDVMSHHFNTFSALASVPWTASEPENDWEWLGEQRPPPYLPVEAQPPGEEPPVGPPPPADKASGCGCGAKGSSSGGGWTAVALLLALAGARGSWRWRRRRSRESGGALGHASH